MGIPTPQLQRVPNFGTLLEEQEYLVRHYANLPTLEELKMLYRTSLMNKTIEGFLSMRGGLYDSFRNYTLSQSERAEIWNEVYEQRTLLRPSMEPGTTLLRASQERTQIETELLRASERNL